LGGVPQGGWARVRHLINALALVERLNPDEHVFYAVRANQRARKVMREKPVGEGTFARWWASCLASAGVAYRSPHTARHTFATRWRRRGLAIAEIQILLGHSSVRTTADLYVHTRVEDVAEHMALIEAQGR
jgi:integrase